ncbi:N-acetylmuramidase family protein [Roseococcus sp. DSY-14]|uniref:N-acetylmuramidase family protein n=1 Tax=Roseococcus sp. DSY-14 TaxID=3369650 RepID=UPI00387B4031
MTRFPSHGQPLDSRGVAEAADLLGVRAAVLWAIVTVETAGCGFLPDRRPVILFERHEFRRRTAGRFDASHPELSGPPGGYGVPGVHQHGRLAAAMRLDIRAAIESASWGLGQLMGCNAALAGHADAQAMAEQFRRSENAQLVGMARFIRSRGLDKHLRQGSWAAFARGYNGPNFGINRYDAKLGQQAAHFAANPPPDLTVRAIQLLLSYQGFAPGRVDGRVGEQTRRAIAAFRSANLLGEGGGHDGLLVELLRRLPADADAPDRSPVRSPTLSSAATGGG